MMCNIAWAKLIVANLCVTEFHCASGLARVCFRFVLLFNQD